MPGGSRSYPPGAQCRWPVLAWAARAGTRLSGGLVRLAGLRVGGADVVELAARADGELGEDLEHVISDRARADNSRPGGLVRECAHGDAPCPCSKTPWAAVHRVYGLPRSPCSAVILSTSSWAEWLSD